jgi:hypothetical protein
LRKTAIPLAKELLVDPAPPSLTLGVLTKADMVEGGEHEQWIKIMNGESHVLSRGYYLTRLPDAEERERNPSPQEVRDNEMAYLSKGPWSSLKRNRVGIEKLAHALSEGLANMIKERYQP